MIGHPELQCEEGLVHYIEGRPKGLLNLRRRWLAQSYGQRGSKYAGCVYGIRFLPRYSEEPSNSMICLRPGKAPIRVSSG